MKLLVHVGLWVSLALGAPIACSRMNRPEPVSRNAVVTPASSQRSVGKTLRVATYNVHMESAAAIVGAIEGNRELAAADVLLLQEIEAHDREPATRAEQVAEALGMSVAYAPGYGLRDGGSHGVAILSRLSLRDLEVIELPYVHVVFNSARRVALAATVTFGGQEVRIYSVHLDNRINPKTRSKQFAPVLKAAQSVSGPVVIAGDLNTSPFCWGVHVVPVPCGRQDNAMELDALGSGLDTPVAKLGSTSKWLGMRLDAIYTRDLVAKGQAVERSVRLSDHLPMWVDLELPERRLLRGTSAKSKSSPAHELPPPGALHAQAPGPSPTLETSASGLPGMEFDKVMSAHLK